MNVFVINEDMHALEELAELIRQASPKATVFCFRSGEDALKEMDDVCGAVFLLEAGEGLSLAAELKRRCPRANLIFLADTGDYAAAAMDLHASGYVQRPCSLEKLCRELEDLRYPVPETPRVRFQTFGNFEVFLDGKPMHFQYEKTREFLAYLVNRGSMVSNGEIMAALWEKEVSESYIRLLRKDLVDALRRAGCEEILVRKRNLQGIRMDLVECDSYDWKQGRHPVPPGFGGEYMAQYSWAEPTGASLLGTE